MQRASYQESGIECVLSQLILTAANSGNTRFVPLQCSPDPFPFPNPCFSKLMQAHAASRGLAMPMRKVEVYKIRPTNSCRNGIKHAQRGKTWGFVYCSRHRDCLPASSHFRLLSSMCDSSRPTRCAGPSQIKLVEVCCTRKQAGVPVVCNASLDSSVCQIVRVYKCTLQRQGKLTRATIVIKSGYNIQHSRLPNFSTALGSLLAYQ
jgi:hypothetical protein